MAMAMAPRAPRTARGENAPLSSRASRTLELARLQRMRGLRAPPVTEVLAERAAADRFGKSFASPRQVRAQARQTVKVSAPKNKRLKHRFKMHNVDTVPAAQDWWLRRGTHLPRDFKHIRPRTPVEVTQEYVEVAQDNRYGFGDIVRLRHPDVPETLAYGAAKNWQTTGVGKVMMGGRRFKGDCLIDINGQRLWVTPNEIDMLAENPDPRPSTAEEIKREQKRRARERKQRQKSKRMQAAKWTESAGGDAEEEMQDLEVQELFDEIDEDGSGFLDKDEVRELLAKLGMDTDPEKLDSVFFEMDNDHQGEVELQEFMWWWKKAGKGLRQQMTKLKDEMNEVKEIFDEIDTDASGELHRDEVQSLLTMLGVKLNIEEMDSTMKDLDADGSGEVNFTEFFNWWKDDDTQEKMGPAKARMAAVKEKFDELDADLSGELSIEEIRMLAENILEVEISETELAAGMAEMDTDQSGEVSFAEFYNWWDGARDGLLAKAKERLVKKESMWQPVEPMKSSYKTRAKREAEKIEIQNQVELKKMAEEARAYKGGQGGGGNAPRLRRCTVEQIFSMGGGGSTDDAMANVDPQAHKLIEASESGELSAVEAVLVDAEKEGHNGTSLVNVSVLGVTALMVAAANSHPTVVSRLLEAGANVMAADEDGMTVWDWVEMDDGNENAAMEIQECIALLRKAGAHQRPRSASQSRSRSLDGEPESEPEVAKVPEKTDEEKKAEAEAAHLKKEEEERESQRLIDEAEARLFYDEGGQTPAAVRKPAFLKKPGTVSLSSFGL